MELGVFILPLPRTDARHGIVNITIHPSIMTCKQLKAKLVELKLPTNGDKAALTARLSGATAKPKAKAKGKAKPVSRLVGEIREAASVLTGEFGRELKDVMEFTPFKVGNSFVLRLPRHKEAIDRLPHNDGAKTALGLLSWLGDAVKEITGDNKQCWVLHETGSFGLYSKFNR